MWQLPKGAKEYSRVTVKRIGDLLPSANFNSNITSGSPPLSVQFTDLSQNSKWRTWYFGDGSTSNEQNPIHVYPVEGTYNVFLSVSNENGTASKNTKITVKKISSSGGNSGGSSKSGVGVSDEDQKNVEVKELSQTYVSSSQAANFTFPKKVTCVEYMGFDSKKTLKKITTTVEILKGKSSLVSKLPDGEIYKSLNIWVGKGGVANASMIKNAVICFKVDKAWTKDKKIDGDSIILNRYATANKKWEKLPTTLLSEDEKCLYFIAKTPEYGSFAITGISSNVIKKNNSTPPLIETSIVMSCSANEYTLGEKITFTAKVKTESSEKEKKELSGIVTFIDGTKLIGNGTGSLEETTFTTSSLLVGRHNITAHYSGDSNFSPSNSSAFILTVQKEKIPLTQTLPFQFCFVVVSTLLSGLLLYYIRDIWNKRKLNSAPKSNDERKIKNH